MPENKKQHYIPQFYLRNFSRDGKQVLVYHFESTSAFLSPISSTCQDKYFYGKDGEFEIFLSELENRQASIIKKIIDTQNIDGITGDEIFDLHSFIMLQFARTKDAKMMAENFVELFVERYIKPMMKGNEELMKKYSPEYIDSLKITMPQFYKFTLGTALSGIEGISDLKAFLVVNKTAKSFISSDAPVVKNNYYTLKTGELTGFQSPGLQIICPLTEKLLILLIHENSYKIESSANSIIKITEEADVDIFNRLQILNHLQILLLIDSKFVTYVQELYDEVSEMKTKKNFVEKTLKTTAETDGGYSEIVSMHTEGLNYRIRFSFLKINHDYNRKFKGRCKQILKKSPVVQPYRNKELSEKMRYQFDQLVEKAEKTANKKNVQ